MPCRARIQAPGMRGLPQLFSFGVKIIVAARASYVTIPLLPMDGDTSKGYRDMANKTFDGTIENAYGRALAQNKFADGKEPIASIKYNASYDEIDSYDAIPSDEVPDKKDILALVNNSRKANARQKAIQDALNAAGVIKPTLEDDVELQIAGMVKSLVASKKYNEEEARKLAKQMLGVS